MNTTEELAYWITQREEMRKRKEGVDPTPPYSNDPVMANVRYCNVRREDDKVTRWIAKNWRDKNFDDYNLPGAMVLARMINWPDTLDDIGYPRIWDKFYKHHVKQVIRNRQARGDKAWTSAYIVSTNGRPMAKEEYVIDLVVDSVMMGPVPQWTTLEAAHRWLMRFQGLGSFMAAQVVADLRNTPGHPLQSAPDGQTWAAPGPGSLRGLTTYFGRPVKERTFAKDLAQCWQEVKPLLPEGLQNLHMQDFQNCMCEFSKYMRVKYGDGRARNGYRPG